MELSSRVFHCHHTVGAAVKLPDVSARPALPDAITQDPGHFSQPSPRDLPGGGGMGVCQVGLLLSEIVN